MFNLSDIVYKESRHLYTWLIKVPLNSKDDFKDFFYFTYILLRLLHTIPNNSIKRHFESHGN